MVDFDARIPSSARIHDYILGGKDNFAADRKLADELLAVYPPAARLVREGRDFVVRAVTWAGEQGISQFVDLGCGMPSEPATWGAARAAAPEARFACNDIDPVAVSHLRNRFGKEHRVAVIEADALDVDTVLTGAREVIDLSRPVGVIMASLLEFFPPSAARDLVARYAAAVVPGSYVVIAIGVLGDGPEREDLVKLLSVDGVEPHGSLYTRDDLVEVIGGLELLPPGVTQAHAWRPGWDAQPAAPATAMMLAAVARVP